MVYSIFFFFLVTTSSAALSVHRARDHNADGIALRKRLAAGAAQLPPHIRGTQHEASAVRVALRATRSLGQNGYDATDEQNRSMPIPSVGNHDKIHGGGSLILWVN